MNITPDVTTYHERILLESKQSKVDKRLGFYARLTTDVQTKKDAYKLRHLCYHSSGYIDACENGEFSDPYDNISSSKTIVIYDNGQPVASIRVCCMDLSSPDPTAKDLPLAHVFPDEFACLLGPHARAIELNRLVRHPAHAQSQGLVFILFRMADFVIRQHDPDFVASCVRSNHVGFYRRLRFEHIAGPKKYTGLSFMTNFLACQRASYEVVRRVIPVLRISSAACKLYEGLLHGETVPVFDHE
jgi:hypothetical protein